MLNFFSYFILPPVPPCNVDLYSPAGGKNELEEKNQHCKGRVTQKFYKGENQNLLTLQGGINLFTIKLKMMNF
jgi:hypothetical protein